MDQWILNEDLGYHGSTYGFGECPPDQFAMNFALEQIKKEVKRPYTLFYLTKNSHSPFIIPEMSGDWRSLNEEEGAKHHHLGFLKKPESKAYFNAIQYQLNNLRNLILEQGKPDDIFLIIGDHQPPVICDPAVFGHQTPVHVVSKNAAFLRGFEAYGFREDLRKSLTAVTHEGLYSIFLREFMKSFGENYPNLPEYEPRGLQI